MIDIRQVTRKYGNIAAVADVSLAISRGEIVGLLGHNGAGKTTLMKMLTGYLEPTSGVITVGDCDVLTQRTAVQRQIGYLPENAPLYHEMLVQEYLLMMSELRGVPADQRVSAVSVAATRAGLGQHLLRPIGQLSKGYRQRVGLAQAIVHNPAVLVLDEPTNGLDPVQIQTIRDLIKRLGKTTTIILSTHILQEVEAVCDRVVILIDGRLSADAPLAELVASRTLRMSVEEGADVRGPLKDVPRITGIRKLGVDPALKGNALWALDLSDGVHPGAEVLAAAQRAGLKVSALAPEQKTLESVFKQLQQEHIARQEAAA